MATSEKLCLQWNDFKENMSVSFGELRADNDFTDITLACEDGKQIEAHKVVLASSSPFFRELLRRNRNLHPLVYMKGLKSEDLSALMDTTTSKVIFQFLAGVSFVFVVWNPIFCMVFPVHILLNIGGFQV